MADDEILRRLDELIASNGAELAALNEHVVETKAEITNNRQAFQDVSTALRQMTLRADRVALDHSRVLQELVAQVREGREEMREEMRDARDEMRAQRQALFAMIDLLRGGGGGPAPASA